MKILHFAPIIAICCMNAIGSEILHFEIYDSINRRNELNQDSSWKEQNTFIFSKPTIEWHSAYGDTRTYTKSYEDFDNYENRTIRVRDENGKTLNMYLSQDYSHLKIMSPNGSTEFIHSESKANESNKMSDNLQPESHRELFTTTIPTFVGVSIGPTEIGGHLQFSMYGGYKHIFLSFSFGSGLGESYDDVIKNGNTFNDPKTDSTITWAGLHIGYIPGALRIPNSDLSIVPFVAFGLGIKEKDFAYTDPTGILSTTQYTVSGDEEDSFSPNIKIGTMINISRIGFYVDINTSKSFEIGVHYNIL